jgi:formyl-CoA transferase
MATPPVLRRAPPALGEHTDEVLAGLGLDAAQVAALRQAGVV